MRFLSALALFLALVGLVTMIVQERFDFLDICLFLCVGASSIVELARKND